MEEAKKKKRNHRAVILTVAVMTAVFLFLVYLNQRPYAHIETQSLADIQAEEIVQTIASKMRLEPEALRVTPAGKIAFDIDETGKLVRPLQVDLQGINGENLQTGTLLLRGQGLYLYRNQTEKLLQNYGSLPAFTQDIDLNTFLSALKALPVAQAARQTGVEKALFYSVEWVYDASLSDTQATLVWKNGETRLIEGAFEITNRETQCIFTVVPHTAHVSDLQNQVQIVMDMGA